LETADEPAEKRVFSKGIGHAEVSLIEDVSRFTSKLQSHSFVYFDCLDHTQINIIKVIAEESVSTHIAVRRAEVLKRRSRRQNSSRMEQTRNHYKSTALVE
jgi:hypothetical protein